MFKRRKNEILSKIENKTILLGPQSANSFGQESKGLSQIRGLGLLILTNRELIFGMYIPKRDLLILLDYIHKVSTPKSHLGKTRFKPLLKIEFTNNQGESDSIAWQIRDLDLWVNTIKNQLKK